MKRLLPLLLACVVFVCSTYVLASEQISEELKGALRKGHFQSCVPVIKDQAERTGDDFTQTMIIRYCTCLGIQYFGSYTKADLREHKRTNSLPRRIKAIRKQIQNRCAAKHLFD